MAIRVVNGNTSTEDGWPLVDQAGCTWIVVPGTSVSLQIQSGVPARVLGAWVADWNAYVEPVYDADSASWTAGNSVLGEFGQNDGSNHLGGTAVDVRWQSHPWKVRNGGLNAAQLATIDEMLDWYENCIWWGGNWPDAYVDPMHSQLGSLSSGEVATYANGGPTPHIIDFIARKIRADGFSTFRRGGTVTPPPAAAGLTAQNLSDAMGGAVSLDRYAQLLPGYRAACVEAGLSGNLNRLAMFAGQLGEESGGLKWMEEIASGSEYEGRADLGNTQPGDGVRFKGRSPIQVTGRSNYTKLSQWAFGQGLVPSPTFFVDQPEQLASDQYGFLGAVWYWTVARPQINSLCDAQDIVGVTKAINGGTNGLADRTNRWNHCLSMGLAALDVQGTTTDPGDDDLSAEAERQIGVIYQEITKKFPSRSPLRHLGEGLVDTATGFVLNTDGSVHVEVCRLLAGYGHPPTLALLREVAGADPVKYPDRQDDAKMAQAILADVTAPPQVTTVVNNVAPVAPVDTRALADANIEIAQLRNENARLQVEVGQLRADAALPPEPLPVAVWQDSPSMTSGDHAAKVIDSVEDWTDHILSMDTKQRAAFVTSMTALALPNGSQS